MSRFDDLITRLNGGIEHGAQLNFAKKLGKSRSAVSLMARGKLMPSLDLLHAMAGILGVKSEELKQMLEEINNPASNINEPNGINQQVVNSRPLLGIPVEATLVPVYGKVSGGTFRLDLARPTGETLPMTTTTAGKYVGLKVHGKGLEEYRMHEGDAIVVELQDWALEDELVLARENASEYAIRRYKKKDGQEIVGVVRKILIDAR